MERIEQLQAFLKDDPSDDFSAYALALEYVKVDRSHEAISLLEKLLNRNAAYLPAYYQLGKMYESLGNLEIAAEKFRRGIEVAKKKKDQKTLNELQSALDMLED
jgi:tetratricopeptide (TPR) repeat protein